MLTRRQIPLWLAALLAFVGAASLAVALVVDWTDPVALVLALLIGLWLAASGGILLVRTLTRDRSRGGDPSG